MDVGSTTHDVKEGTKLPQFFTIKPEDHMTEPVTPIVTGEVPKWLSGSLYRNGSGMYKVGETMWKHLFDGFAVLHRWTIENGKVTFLMSILDTEVYNKAIKANRIIGQSFGSNFPDPCKTLFKKVASHFIPEPPGKSDNTGVNVVEFGDRLFAMTETPLINEVKPGSMTVKKQIDVGDLLTVHMGTAHPLKSPDGSAMYYYGTHMNYKQAYNFIRIPKPKDPENPFEGAEVVARAPSRWKMNISYTHAFGLTENYFVHIEQPMTLNLPKMMTLSMRGVAISDCFVCHPDEPIIFIVVHNKTGERIPIRWFAKHGFVFHFGNAYEEDGHIIVDVAFYNDPTIIKAAYVDEITKSLQTNTPPPEGELTRFVLPLSLEGAEPGKNLVTLPNCSATAVLRKGSKDILDVTPDNCFDPTIRCDLPKWNDDYTGLKTRYTYCSSALSPANRRLLKFDAQDRTVKQWHCEDTHQPSEPVFSPRPGATAEDDGVVMCTIISSSTEVPSYLVILDAKTWTEVARATVPKENKVSFTFHGFFGSSL